MPAPTDLSSSTHFVNHHQHRVPLPLPVPPILAWILAPCLLNHPHALHDTRIPYHISRPTHPHSQKKKSSTMPKVSAKESKTTARAAPVKRAKKDKDPNKPKR